MSTESKKQIEDILKTTIDPYRWSARQSIEQATEALAARESRIKIEYSIGGAMVMGAVCLLISIWSWYQFDQIKPVPLSQIYNCTDSIKIYIIGLPTDSVRLEDFSDHDDDIAHPLIPPTGYKPVYKPAAMPPPGNW